MYFVSIDMLIICNSFYFKEFSNVCYLPFLSNSYIIFCRCVEYIILFKVSGINALLFPGSSFDNNAIYQQRSLGPIQQSAILLVDPVKGNVLKASGRNM